VVRLENGIQFPERFNPKVEAKTVHPAQDMNRCGL